MVKNMCLSIKMYKKWNVGNKSQHKLVKPNNAPDVYVCPEKYGNYYKWCITDCFFPRTVDKGDNLAALAREII